MNEQEHGSDGGIVVLDPLDDTGGKRIQVFINESRIYDGEDKIEAHKILSLCERIVAVLIADAKVQIFVGNEESVREYFQGKLLSIPNSLVMQINEVTTTKDKFGG